MKKRWLAIAMALVMALSLLPVSTLALERDADSTEPPVTENPVDPPEDPVAAKIGDTAYATLTAAIQEAKAGAEIVLQRDIQESITIDKPIILNLNKKTLTASEGSRVILVSIENAEEEAFLTIQNGTITGGVSEGYDGGGIWVSEAMSQENVPLSINLNSLNIKNNQAANGAGLYIDAGEVTIEDSIISENAATNSGGGIYLTTKNSSTSCLMKDVAINNNRALVGAGVGMGAAQFETLNYTATLTLESGTISNNVAERERADTGGGGLYLVGNGSRFYMCDGEISDNTTNGSGGGIFSTNWRGVEITGGTIAGNTAKSNGGGVYIKNVNLAKNPLEDEVLTVGSGVAIVNNTATNGGGIYALDGVTVTVGEVAAVYNNTGKAGGDDIMMSGANSLTLPAADTMSGDRILTSTQKLITGWYYDGYESSSIRDRWAQEVKKLDIDATIAAGKPVYNYYTYYKEYVPSEDSCSDTIALKAAHAPQSSITGTVFNDKNRDYVYKDSDDEVFKDDVIAVTLWRQNGDKWELSTETTTENGSYSFAGLASGTYKVQLADRPSGVNRDCGLNDDAQGNKFANLQTSELTVKANEDVVANAGFYYKSSPSKPDPKPPILNTEDHFGYIIGYPVDYFTGEPTDDQTKKPVKPQGNITRAEVATIFFRMLTDEARTEYWSSTNSYTDVPAEAWYNNAVSTLTNAGIIDGYTDGSFKPNGKITRAEFATIAVRFFDSDYNGEDLFPDIDGHWAQDYINQAGDAGIIQGYPDGTFGPQKLITRAEAVTMVNRTLDRHPDQEHFLPDMLVWPDNMDTTKWYYADMQEATNSHEYEMKTNSDGKYEIWTKMLPIRDWEAFEKEWSDAGSASNPGEVVR